MVHSLRAYVDHHWEDDDFVVLKVDLHNAFNNASRQAVLNQCHSHFPERLPWVSWCYSYPTNLWHPLGSLSSTSCVQQGDALGSLLFSLVIHLVIENTCESLFFNKWYWIKVLWLGPRLALIRHFLFFFAKTPYLTFMMLSLHAPTFPVLSFLGHQLEIKAFVKTLHHQPSGLPISCTSNCRN